MELIFSYLAEHFDLPILLWIREYLQSAFGDVIFPIITLFGEFGIFWIAIALVLIIIPKTRKIGLGMGLALLLGVILCNAIMKPLAARIRPYAYLLEHDGIKIQLIVKEMWDYSFPSGHTIACFEAAVVLRKYTKKWGIPAIILAILVSFSRLYLFLHYPTDVLVSVVLGILIAFLADWIVGQGYKLYYSKRSH